MQDGMNEVDAVKGKAGAMDAAKERVVQRFLIARDEDSPVHGVHLDRAYIMICAHKTIPEPLLEEIKSEAAPFPVSVVIESEPELQKEAEPKEKTPEEWAEEVKQAMTEIGKGVGGTVDALTKEMRMLALLNGFAQNMNMTTGPEVAQCAIEAMQALDEHLGDGVRDEAEVTTNDDRDGNPKPQRG